LFGSLKAWIGFNQISLTAIVEIYDIVKKGVFELNLFWFGGSGSGSGSESV